MAYKQKRKLNTQIEIAFILIYKNRNCSICNLYKVLFDIGLADQDYRNFEENNKLWDLYLKECNLFTNIVMLNKNMINNQFIKLDDYKKNHIILYAHDKQLYKPICNKINRIKIISIPGYCFDNIPVTFQLNSSNGTSMLL